MGDVIDLAERRAAKEAALHDMATWCMACGGEYPWGERHEHRCDLRTGSGNMHPSQRS